MTRIVLLAVLVGAPLAVAGCDPGWTYRIPNARTVGSPAPQYVVDLGAGVDAMFRGQVFTSHGWVEVEVVNHSSQPVDFEPTPTTIMYAGGKPVNERRCEFVPADQPVIVKDMTIAVRCSFVLMPASGFRDNPEYRTLQIDQKGFSRAGAPIPIATTMEWAN